MWMFMEFLPSREENPLVMRTAPNLNAVPAVYVCVSDDILGVAPAVFAAEAHAVSVRLHEPVTAEEQAFLRSVIDQCQVCLVDERAPFARLVQETCHTVSGNMIYLRGQTQDALTAAIRSYVDPERGILSLPTT